MASRFRKLSALGCVFSRRSLRTKKVLRKYALISISIPLLPVAPVRLAGRGDNLMCLLQEIPTSYHRAPTTYTLKLNLDSVFTLRITHQHHYDWHYTGEVPASVYMILITAVFPKVYISLYSFPKVCFTLEYTYACFAQWNFVLVCFVCVQLRYGLSLFVSLI